MTSRVTCYIGIGANLAPDGYADPMAGLVAALGWLADREPEIIGQSSWYASAPVPVSDQPDFINAVAALSTALPAEALLDLLNEAEAAFGRVRRQRNEARVLDLDILDFGNQIIQTPRLTVPHIRLPDRAFVLLPLAELAPDWVHPVSGQDINSLIRNLPPDQKIRRLPDQDRLA